MMPPKPQAGRLNFSTPSLVPPNRTEELGESQTFKLPKSILKRKPNSPTSSFSVSFSNLSEALLVPTKEEVKVSEAKLEALMSAAAMHGSEPSSTSVSDHSNSSGNSMLSTRLHIQNLAVNAPASLEDEIKKFIDAQIAEFATQLFPCNSMHRTFASKLLRKGFYNQKDSQLDLLISQAPQNKISPTLWKQINAPAQQTRDWLAKVSLRKIVSVINSKASRHYTNNTFAAILFEQFLLIKLISKTNNLSNYSHAVDIITNAFPPQENMAPLQQAFDLKLKKAINFLPPTLPLWHIYHFLWTYSDTFFLWTYTNTSPHNNDLELGLDDNEVNNSDQLSSNDALTDWQKYSRNENKLITQLREASLSDVNFKHNYLGQKVFKTLEDVQSDTTAVTKQKYLVTICYAAGIIAFVMEIFAAANLITTKPDAAKHAVFTSLAVVFVGLGLYVRSQRNEAIQLQQIALQTLSLFAKKKAQPIQSAPIPEVDNPLL